MDGKSAGPPVLPESSPGSSDGGGGFVPWQPLISAWVHPELGSQASTVQSFSSSQETAVPAAHCPSSQTGEPVQASPGPQIAPWQSESAQSAIPSQSLSEASSQSSVRG